MPETIKYLLDETRIPRVWYNIMADLPSPPPPVLHPGTMKPVGPDDLAPLFPMSLIMQAYIDFFAGKLTDQSYDEAELAMALAGLPPVKAA